MEKQEQIKTLLLQQPSLTYQAIGDKMGITRQRVDQIRNDLGIPKRVRINKTKAETIRKHRLVTQRLTPNRHARVEYAAYHKAKERCSNPKHQGYKYYGARGIEFRFKSFVEFFAEIGPKPLGKTKAGRDIYSLDRKDNDGHYESGNVQWSTQAEQTAIGRRRTRKKSLDIM